MKGTKKMHRMAGLVALLLLVALLAGGMPVQAGPVQEPGDAGEDAPGPVQEPGDAGEDAPEPEVRLHTVTENDSFRLEYDEEGADLYITDLRSGKVWSNTVDADYYPVEESSRNMMSQLMTVTVASEDGRLSVVNVFDNGAGAANYKLEHRYEGEELVLSMSLASGMISFDIHMGLCEEGFYYEIPGESVVEKGEGMLVNIQLMPIFGAAVSGEEEFLLIPDGSGTLIRHKSYDDPNARLYMYPFYGTDVLDLKKIQENQEQGYHNLMLPVYGISHGDGAMLAAVTEGEADCVLNVAPGGFKFSGLNRAYLTLNYRIYYSTQVNGNDYIQIIPNNYTSTRRVQIFLLDGEHTTYSDMAGVYRDYLEQEGILKEQESRTGVPLVVNLVMGAGESSLFGKKLITATTYSQAAEILADLGSGVPKVSAVLEGWGKGGFDTLPTDPALEKKFGGKRDFKKLLTACEEENVDLYLKMDFINGDVSTGDFNNRKDTVRSGFGTVVNEGDRYLLNPVQVLEDCYEDAVKTRKLSKGQAICFDTLGQLLTYDHSSSRPASRTQAQEACETVLGRAAAEQGQVAVSGGNQYVLPYAALLDGIPDSGSDYYLGDEAVPFYQMVVHGSVDYTSTAGNHSYDLQYQKLKWIETGSLPSFVLTYESPSLLHKTACNDLFSSEYAVWKDTVKEVAGELNDRLGQVWNQKMVRHERQEDLVVITYEDGTRVLINYTDQPVQRDGITIPAMDYSVGKGA